MISELEQNDAKTNLMKICGSSSSLWKKLEADWLSDIWIDGWVDFGRPGDRRGLWNTNNASESFFKSLLRNYLGGQSYCASEVISTILGQVFPGCEDLLDNPSRRGKNPTLKRLEKIEKTARSLCEKSKLKTKTNSLYETKESGPPRQGLSLTSP